MLRKVKSISNFPVGNCRTFKNFGHKREAEPTFTVLWHGFLTFSFIACGLNWKKIRKFFETQELDDASKERLESFIENK